jgi:1-aminocyclopropane-1-carboxylate deaminase
MTVDGRMLFGFISKLACFLIKTVGTVFATTLAAITSFEVVFFCKYNKALFRVIVIFVFYLSLAVIHFFRSASLTPKDPFCLMTIHSPILQSVELLPGTNVWIKRLDVVHPEFGGNKWYKLKYNIEQLNTTTHRTMLTFGGAWSNHIAATAAAGRHFGFHTIGVIRGEEPAVWSATLLKAKEDGMALFFVSREMYAMKESEDMKMWLLEQFGSFLLVPEGGSNFLGINGCMEILDENDQQFDTVVTACGTGATMAGMMLAAGANTQFWGVPVMKQGNFIREEIRKHLTYFLMDAQAASDFVDRLHLLTDYHFGGYGRWNDELLHFITSFTDRTNIRLDQVYTGKALYALREAFNRGIISKDTKVLFVHTGGLQGTASLDGKNNSIELME